MRWTQAERYMLLLKIIEQNPDVLSAKKVDVEKIRSTWPGAEVPTSRMIPYQLTEIRKEIQNGCGSSLTSNSGSVTTPSTPSRPKVTPNKSSNSTNHNGSTTVTPSKRTSAKDSGTPSSAASSAKKRKLSTTPSSKRKTNIKATRYGSDDDLHEPIDLTSSSDEEEATINDATDSDNPLAAIPVHGERRVLPARSKSRSKSYVADDDSAGEDAGAKATDSEVDGEFKLEGEESEGGGRNGFNGPVKPIDNRESTVEAAGPGVINGNRSGNGNANGEEVEDVKVASDVESVSTKRHSFQSAVEFFDDDD